MDEEAIKKEVLEFYDYMFLKMEIIHPINIYDYIQVVNEEAKRYEEKLREEYSLKLKR